MTPRSENPDPISGPAVAARPTETCIAAAPTDPVHLERRARARANTRTVLALAIAFAQLVWVMGRASFSTPFESLAYSTFAIVSIVATMASFMFG